MGISSQDLSGGHVDFIFLQTDQRKAPSVLLDSK